MLVLKIREFFCYSTCHILSGKSAILWCLQRHFYRTFLSLTFSWRVSKCIFQNMDFYNSSLNSYRCFSYTNIYIFFSFSKRKLSISCTCLYITVRHIHPFFGDFRSPQEFYSLSSKLFSCLTERSPCFIRGSSTTKSSRWNEKGFFTCRNFFTYFRTSIPLITEERLSFYIQAHLCFARSPKDDDY